ncbi:exodeoxyribonuclease V subunit gamma [Photobacterium gaetbulicola]|uniref:RecBCD enzyme subunit RecC n=1 Tax=Photobacterium gaetbulicola Gung47 TaxID=658445 RepID=A0A0C5WR91_9GAMM|nr:exodeoxyribonuclease V subunit gamma [Photobacterium gaetbulicola]AJR07604.1 exonuclease V subunit gamma [Photobacterium gaetbulicola Gung47]PSU03812.1 exodeoxyribonuclease V subunit gamma [Photobacterium gaetbulicola]
MFTVYHSNQLDLLKSLLVELIRLDPLDNPFEQEQILVQSPGMSQWLKLELAKSQGIAANIEFPLPATFIWNMFTKVLSDVPERSAFNKEAMTWKLLQVLPAQLSRPEFAPLANYLCDDANQVKSYQLAEKIADIFDQYLVYRPEWIQSWESDTIDPELVEEHPWQPLLWQALYDHTLALGQSPYHRANLYDHFIETLEGYLQSGSPLPAGLPKRLFVFGISALPPRYLDALAALGKHIDVHLMFTNPCRHYWGDVRDRKFLARLAAKQRQQLQWCADHSEHGAVISPLKGDIDANVVDETHEGAVSNTLLASLGKLGRDNLYLLSEMEAYEVEAFVDIAPDSLLHAVQADILNLEDRINDEITESSHHKLAIAADDRSLSVHACHSPMREVEVLHDNLLAMLADTPDLSPRDIVVMVADINSYSPYIQAVFGNAPGERYIPFSISDRSADQENPALLAFLRLLALPESRCQASELLELLEVPAVMARFGFDSDKFERVKLWIEEVGIRWGLDDDTAEEFALPRQQQNTWLFGLQRMLLGYAMPQEAGLYQGVLGYEEVQGLDAELAGQLGLFIETLMHYRQQLAQQQPIASWMTLLNQMLDDCFAVEIDGELVLRMIRDKIQQLEQQLADAGYDAEITPAVMRDYLNGKLSGERVSQRFLAGQVNFCTLMPMRSIPFKVVCLLGMNDGVYPRSIPPEGFDLMAGRARHGDRSRRDDDRYLFLEAIQSAQQALYISYVGRSIQDNSEKVPSVLVSELLEYCQQGYCLAGDETLPVDQSAQRLVANLTQTHPLVPFSPQSFSGANHSYAAEWLPVANQAFIEPEAFQSAPLEPDLSDDRAEGVLELAELARFWRLPVQYFFNRRLKVFFDGLQGGPEDDEPFALDGLGRYQLREALLTTFLDCHRQQSLGRNTFSRDQAFEQFARYQQAAGGLPVAQFGELELMEERGQIEQLADSVVQFMAQPLPDVEVDCVVTVAGRGIRLQGWLKHVTQQGLVRYRPGKIRAQDILACWLDHLCLAVMKPSQPTYLIGIDGRWLLEPVSAQYALEQLAVLVEGYDSGLTQPLPYFPRTAHAGILASIDKKGQWCNDDATLAKAESKRAEAFNGGYMFEGEGNNSYIYRVWPLWDGELAAQLQQWEDHILKPAVMQLREVEQG